MKRLPIIYFSICIFLCAPFSIKSQIQELQFADSLFSVGQFRYASILYEKVSFLYSDEIFSFEASFKKSQCFKQLHQFDKAIAVLNSLNYFDKNDSVYCKVLYEIALCNYLNQNFSEANSILLRLKSKNLSSEILTQILVLQILSASEISNWQLVSTLFDELEKFQKPSNDSLAIVIRKTISDNNKINLKNIKTASWMSMIVPGSGQIYAGFPAEGLLNFSLNACALSFGLIQALNGYFITGYFLGAGMMQNFYFGGLRRTKFLVEKKNFETLRTANDKLKVLLLNYIEK